MKFLVNATFACLMLCGSICFIHAQTTEFTYQGSLRDGAAPASGSYDFEFRLFDAVSGGTQIGSTLTRSGVAAANGVFTVNLDFGNGFPGADRYLEIAVRNAGGGTFTPLSPRQRVASAPYSVKSLDSNTADNASRLGGVSASSYLQTNGNGSGLTNLNASNIASGTVPSGRLGNAVLNQTSQQAGANFNISGEGTASMLSALSSYKLNGLTVLRRGGVTSLYGGFDAGTNASNSALANTFFGASAGKTTTTGAGNSFFGTGAGFDHTTGSGNSIFGHLAGSSVGSGSGNAFFGSAAGYGNGGDRNSFFGYESGRNSLGAENSFFGSEAGFNNEGSFNSFFGVKAGRANLGSFNSFFGYQTGVVTTGAQNAFFGYKAGESNSNGSNNSFLGQGSGNSNITGNHNTFVGMEAGYTNTIGSGNTAIGKSTRVGLNNSGATAIGHLASATCSDCMVLGAIAGVNGATSSVNVGIGTTSPTSRLHIDGTGIQRAKVNSDNNAGFQISLNGNNRWSLAAIPGVTGGDFVLFNDATASTALFVGGSSNTIGINTTTPDTNSKLDVNGVLRVQALASAGATELCRNGAGQIATCSSSLRYKKNIHPYHQGLNLVSRLRPITFDWKHGGMHDLGFGAEDVAKVDPLLVTYNENGIVEGVKYDRIAAVLVNAVKEQQKQIEAQQRMIERQQKQINALTKARTLKR